MAAKPEARITEQEYLERERAAEFRSDYYDGFVYAMSGGNWNHGTLIQNVNRLLDGGLRVEVLSPSTERCDRGAKAAQYRSVESLKELAFVSQEEPRVEVYCRRGPNEWVLTESIGLDACCRFESVGRELAMAQIYEGLKFDQDATSGLL